MSLFAISDLHLSLGTDKSMDIFSGWKDYVTKIESNWKKVVSADDTVVISGDISWAMKLEETYNDMSFINSLPGNKIFIKGNHDFWWSTKAKVENYFAKNGFDTLKILFNNAYRVSDVAVCGSRGWFLEPQNEADKKILAREIGRVEASLKSALQLGGEPIVFLHYPPMYGDFMCEPMVELLRAYDIKKCYYGHIHGKKMMTRAMVDNAYGIDFSLISCDYTNFKPIVIK